MAQLTPSTALPLEQWSEEKGDVLWWKFPIEEPPYVGTPLDTDWTGNHTHYTPIPVPTGFIDDLEPPGG